MTERRQWITAVFLGHGNTSFPSTDTPLSIGEGNGLEMGSVMLSAPASLSNDNRHNTEPLTASLCECECLASQTDRPLLARA